MDVLREKKIIKFYEYVEVGQTFDEGEYDRTADKPWTRLTPSEKVHCLLLTNAAVTSIYEWQCKSSMDRRVACTASY